MIRAALTLALAVALTASPALAETRRLALVVGNNAGTGELPPLRFAEGDAGKVARVLVELGQVAPEDLYLLQGRPVAEVERAIALLAARVAEVQRSPDARAVLIFFFSGHSDGEGLELGRERLLFSRAKALLASTGAEVRVAFIDACRSGAAISAKGGRPAPAFTIRLSDELNATGEAMLTSSAADEIALESKEVQGSYFTHHLVSGLRGAADASGDGLVTLSEAYRYAYDRTLSSTAATLGGTQHPVYDYRLSGQGELVLTVLQRATAGLELPAGLERGLVTDVVRDQVVAEVLGDSGHVVALTPGSYGVRAFRGGKGYGGRFNVAAGTIRRVSWDELRPTELPVVARKGDLPTVSRPAPVRAKKDDSWTSLSVAYGVSKPVAGGVGLNSNLRLAWDPFRAMRVTVLGSFGNAYSGGFGEYTLQLRAGFHFSPQAGPVQFLIGLDLGPGVVWQTASGQDAGSSLMFAIGPRAGLRIEVVGPFFVTLEGEAMLGVAKVDMEAAALFLPAGHLGLGWRF